MGEKEWGFHKHMAINLSILDFKSMGGTLAS